FFDQLDASRDGAVVDRWVRLSGPLARFDIGDELPPGLAVLFSQQFVKDLIGFIRITREQRQQHKRGAMLSAHSIPDERAKFSFICDRDANQPIEIHKTFCRTRRHYQRIKLLYEIALPPAQPQRRGARLELLSLPGVIRLVLSDRRAFLRAVPTGLCVAL